MDNKFFYNSDLEVIQYLDRDGFSVSIDNDIVGWDMVDRRSAQISLMDRLNKGFLVLRDEIGVDEFLTRNILKYVNISRSSRLSKELSMHLAGLHNKMAEYIINECDFVNDIKKARKEVSRAIGACKFGINFVYLRRYGFGYEQDLLPEESIEVYSTDYIYGENDKDVDYNLFDRLSQIAMDYNMYPVVQYASVHEGLISIYSMPENPLLKDGIELLNKLSTNNLN